MRSRECVTKEQSKQPKIRRFESILIFVYICLTNSNIGMPSAIHLAVRDSRLFLILGRVEQESEAVQLGLSFAIRLDLPTHNSVPDQKPRLQYGDFRSVLTG